jgi:hypothetical protein
MAEAKTRAIHKAKIAAIAAEAAVPPRIAGEEEAEAPR